MLRRDFVRASAGLLAPLAFGAKSHTLSHKERVDLALAGKEVDRPPFSFWHHFGITDPEAHAARTLEFHRSYRTDIVKVMSDFPYPKAAGQWYELKLETNPFPQQIKALEIISSGLKGQAYFIETLFNPWNVAEKLSSKEAVRELKQSNPQALLSALDVITESEISHAKRAISLGAAGVLLSVANANKAELSLEDYRKFSAPFDRRILAATRGAKLNVLHLHVEPLYLDQFRDFPAPVVNYSHRVSGIAIADVRKRFGAVIAGGIDEVDYRKFSEAQLKEQWEAASKAAGRKFILTPGCSVPNESVAGELSRLPAVLGA